MRSFHRFCRALALLFIVAVSTDVRAQEHDFLLPDTKVSALIKQLLHRLGGDDLEAYFGINPRIVLMHSLQPNAFAVAPNTIVLTSALLDNLESQDELAFALAHELGHFALGHTTQHRAHQALAAPSMTTQIAHEMEADAFAWNLLDQAKLDRQAGLRLLTRLSRFGHKGAAKLALSFPSFAPRLEVLANQH